MKLLTLPAATVYLFLINLHEYCGSVWSSAAACHLHLLDGAKRSLDERVCYEMDLSLVTWVIGMMSAADACFVTYNEIPPDSVPHQPVPTLLFALYCWTFQLWAKMSVMLTTFTISRVCISVHCVGLLHSRLIILIYSRYIYLHVCYINNSLWF